MNASRTNGAVIDTVDRVRQAFAEADKAGEPRPGRPTLAATLGVTQHQVRMAQATLAIEPAPAPPAARQDEPEPAVAEPVPVDVAPVEPPPAAVPDASPPATVASPPAPATKPPSRWPLLVIGLGAAVAVWSGWVGLGELTGFGVIRPLPGIWDSLRLNTAVVLPLSVEAYAAYALRVWLGGSRSPRTTTFARRSSVASLGIGMAAQVGYHLMAAAHITTAPWPVTVLVACVPVLVLGLAAALAHLVANDTTTTTTTKI